MRGTTTECLVDYGTKHPGSHNLAVFADASPRTAQQWLQGKSVPKGANLIAARVFLTERGYIVSEFCNIPQPAKELARVIAYKRMNPEVIRQEMGYSELSTLYKVVLQGAGLSQERLHRLEAILGRFRDHEHAIAAGSSKVAATDVTDEDEFLGVDDLSGNNRVALHLLLALYEVMREDDPAVLAVYLEKHLTTATREMFGHFFTELLGL